MVDAPHAAPGEGRAGRPDAARLRDGRDVGDALRGQRKRLEGRARLRALVARAGADPATRARRSSSSSSCSCSRRRGSASDRRELLFLVAFGIVGIALVQWLYFVAIDNLPGRRRAPDQVHRAALRRALRAVRLRRAHPTADLGRARPLHHRPRARRRDLGRCRVQRRRGHRGLRGRVRPHRVPPDGRARAEAPRRRLALVLRLPLRRAPLGGHPAAVGRSHGTSLDDAVSLQGNLSEYSAPVWVAGLRSSSSSGRW